MRNRTIIVGVVLWLGRAWGQEAFSLETISLGNGREVEFTSAIELDAETTAKDCAGAENKMPRFGSSGAHRLYVNLELIRHVPRSNQTTYSFCVEEAGKFRSYRVNAIPTGSFGDRWASTAFTLASGGRSVRGRVDLPVHSDQPKDFIEVVADPAAVDLPADRHRLKLKIRNLLDGFRVRVEGMDLTADHPKYWVEDSSFAGVSALKLEEAGRKGSSVEVDASADLNPYIAARFWSAVWSSLTSPRPIHDQLHADVRYSADLGGNPRTVRTEIQVTFRPPWAIALLLALVGALAGNLAATVVPAMSRPRTVRTFLSSLAFGGGGWLVLFALSAMETDFRVLGFKFDPGQLFFALFLGLVIGFLGRSFYERLGLPGLGSGKG